MTDIPDPIERMLRDLPPPGKLIPCPACKGRGYLLHPSGNECECPCCRGTTQVATETEVIDCYPHELGTVTVTKQPNPHYKHDRTQKPT